MFTQFVPLPAAISCSTPAIRRKREAMALTTQSKRASLTAKRKERIPLPKYGDRRNLDFPISEFFKHPSGIEALLNTRALQSYEPIDSHTYRCTLHKIQLLNADVVPVMDLRVTPTSEDCTVVLRQFWLSIDTIWIQMFVGPETVQNQNEVFSAFMINHIIWEDNVLEPYLEVDVVMKITLEVFTVPFNLLPVSMVEAPGNLVMQGLIDRFVPLLGEQILQDYHAWIEERFRLSSQHSHKS